MAKASTTEVFPCSTSDFFKIISDYEKYHEFLNEVKKCQVIKTEKNRKLVEYTVSVIKEFKYQLWMTEVKDKSIVWELAGGDLFKKSIGSWHLEDVKGKCKATYSVEAEFNMFVPAPIAKALVSVNLPGMISSYHQRIKKIYG